MSTPDKLMERLEAIAHSVVATGHSLALQDLGSVGKVMDSEEAAAPEARGLKMDVWETAVALLIELDGR